MAAGHSAVSWRTAVTFPGVVGTLAFNFYVAWNGFWLALGRIPPSILLGLTGLPAPTTGMTRSTEAFLQARWADAFLWNPFTIPFALLLLATLLEAGWKKAGRRRVVLSRPLALAWPALLLCAWAVKLAMGPRWW